VALHDMERLGRGQLRGVQQVTVMLGHLFSRAGWGARTP
jgi:hypothetical protein